MYKPGHFWCEECGTDRPYDDAVNEIIDGEALCYRCNHQLETELANSSPQHPLTKATQTPAMSNAIAKQILREADEQKLEDQ